MDKLNARDGIVKEVSSIDARPFLNKNHKQGFLASKVYVGLFIKNELVFLMTFGKPRFNKDFEWEIYRLCSRDTYLVRGGASKVYKYFLENYKPSSVLSYCFENGSNTGLVYENLGFYLHKITSPSYGYQKDNIYLDRTKCQKKKLPDLLGDNFDPNLSESQNMLKNGYSKIIGYRSKVYAWDDL